MLTIAKHDSHRIELTMRGKIDAADMERTLDEFLAVMRDVEHGKLLFDIADFHFPSLDALGVKFVRLPELFGLMKRIDRIAILTDENWMHSAIKAEDFLFPSIDISAYPRAARADAEAWLTAGEPLADH
jgi:hypothetical protein